MRDTSIESYNKIKENGLLNRVNLEIYSCVFESGPLTIKETCRLLPHLPETTISPRFADLERQGVLSFVEKRKCRITSNSVMSWDVTSKLPVKGKKAKKINYRDILLAIWRHPHCTKELKTLITDMSK